MASHAPWPWWQGLFYRHRSPDHEAPTMVHLHGFAISGTSLLPASRLLSEHFDTYVPDLPGHGRSPGPPRPLGTNELADAAVRFLDDLGLERATFVGSSLGAAVTARIAKFHPDRIDRAVLVAPAGGVHNRSLTKATAQLAYDAVLEPPGLMALALPDYLKFGPINALRLFHEMVNTPTVSLVNEVHCPMLVVVGARDPLLPKGARMSALLDAATGRGTVTVVRIPNAAHALHYSHPAEVAAIIGGYVGDPSLRSAQLPANLEVLVSAQA